MTPPMMFSLLCDEKGYLEQSELQECHISTNRKTDGQKEGKKEGYRSLLILLKYYAANAAIKHFQNYQQTD